MRLPHSMRWTGLSGTERIVHIGYSLGAFFGTHS